MSFDVVKNPKSKQSKHYCSDEIFKGALDNYPVGTVVRCTICGQFWKATSRVTDSATSRKVPQWRRLYWRTVWARYKEYMYS